jgi:glycosyltransferase family protein
MSWRYHKSISIPRKIIKYLLSGLYPFVIKLYPLPKVYSIEETLDMIITNRASISRYGDGEFLYIIDKVNLPFQIYDNNLRERMIKILKSEEENHFVGLPIGYQSLDNLIPKSRITWRSQITWIYPRLRKYLNPQKHYCNSSMTRVYVTLKDKSISKIYFEKLMMIWHDRDVVLIEGEKSRLGVGNDLFAKTRSLRRILAPAHHAFSRYQNIIAEAMKLSKEKLILIALGPTATVLAFDLAKTGYQAIDIGNVDIEYEWYKMGALSKVKIPGKYTSEAVGGRIVEDIDDEQYNSQIIKRIL